MRSLLRSTVVAFIFVGAAASLTFAAAPGFVDFGKFSPAAGQQYVEVDLDGSLLKLAAVFADKQDAELGKLVANLERVRVNVLGMSDETRQSTIERVQSIRRGLDEQGWKRVVTVTGKPGEDVAIFLKQGADDAVQGVVITVVDSGNEAVLVNVVGNVKLEQIATLGARLDLEPLRKLNLANK